MVSFEKELLAAIRQTDLGTFKNVLARPEVKRTGDLRRNVWKNQAAPLHSAARQGKDDMIHALIAAGVNVNSFVEYEDGERCTALHWAVCRNQTSTVKLLLDLGADKMLEGSRFGLSGTTLDWAREKSSAEILDILSKHERGVQSRPSQRDISWEREMIEAISSNNRSKFMSILAREEVRVNGRLGREEWNSDEAVLHSAARHGRDEMLKFLIGAGANINSFAVNKKGESCAVLHWAVYRNRESTVEILLDHGADKTVEGKRWDCSGTPLEWARQREHLGITIMLEEHIGNPYTPSHSPRVRPQAPHFPTLQTPKVPQRSEAPEVLQSLEAPKLPKRSAPEAPKVPQRLASQAPKVPQSLVSQAPKAPQCPASDTPKVPQPSASEAPQFTTGLKVPTAPPAAPTAHFQQAVPAAEELHPLQRLPTAEVPSSQEQQFLTVPKVFILGDPHAKISQPFSASDSLKQGTLTLKERDLQATLDVQKQINDKILRKVNIDKEINGLDREKMRLIDEKSELAAEITSLQAHPSYRTDEQIVNLMKKIEDMHSFASFGKLRNDEARKTSCPLCFETPESIFSCPECENWFCKICCDRVTTCPSCRLDFKENPSKRNRGIERALGI